MTAGGWYLYRHDWPSSRLREEGSRAERYLNRELSRVGVTDRHVTHQVRRERRRFFFIRWVETRRDIALENLGRVREIDEDLARVAQEQGFTTDQDRIRDAQVLDVSRFGVRFQRIVLYSTKK